MEPNLLPCPFCGGTETQIRPNTYWTGMKSLVMSVEIHHWCAREEGVRGSHIVIRAKTETEAIERWNKRESNSG